MVSRGLLAQARRGRLWIKFSVNPNESHLIPPLEIRDPLPPYPRGLNYGGGFHLVGVVIKLITSYKTTRG